MILKLVFLGDETPTLQESTENIELLSDGHFKCCVCTKTFNTYQQCFVHMSTKHKKTVRSLKVKCTLCDKIVPSRCVRRHMKNEHDMNILDVFKQSGESEPYQAVAQYICGECYKPFETQEQCSKHVKDSHVGDDDSSDKTEEIVFKCGKYVL